MKSDFFHWFYRYLLRPILFKIDPETIHDSFLSVGHFLGRFSLTRFITNLLFNYQNPTLIQTVAGITFQNPVGLSEGFDKDASLLQILPSVGFGFTQVGTITNKPYLGNPKPRLYRLPKSKGIVVYYGLKNLGADKILNKIKRLEQRDLPVGISVGKTNSPTTATPMTGIEDYYQCFKKVIRSRQGDFYTINISCPNTFGGEPFTTPETLDPLLKKLISLKPQKPVFLKMPINLPWKEFRFLLDIAVKYQVTGVIIGNLNKNRQDPAIKDAIPVYIKGSVSGLPTQKLSNELISLTYKHYSKKLVIIGVGGIFSAEDAYDKIKRGATLVQLITGMIYEGPQLIGDLNRSLVKLLKQDGYTHIHQAIGSIKHQPNK